MRGRRRRARRSGAFGTWVGLAALLAYLLGARGGLVVAGLAAVVALDIAAAAVVRSRRRRRLRTLQGFLSLSPASFEAAVAGLLRRLGYRRVRVVGGAGDLAADIVCAGPAGERVVAQCKRYAPGHHVGSPAVQAFIGMAFVHHRAARAIFVTTSSFTPSARQLARAHPIELVDGDRLVELARSRQANTRRSAGWTPPPPKEVPVP
jgi:restriction system protein